MSDADKIGFTPATAPLVGVSPDQQMEYWHALIGEREAAEFLQLSVRTLQGLRQRGGSPRFVRISHRAVRYRRLDLTAWAEARLKTSTWDD